MHLCDLCSRPVCHFRGVISRPECESYEPPSAMRSKEQPLELIEDTIKQIHFGVVWDRPDRPCLTLETEGEHGNAMHSLGMMDGGLSALAFARRRRNVDISGLKGKKIKMLSNMTYGIVDQSEFDWGSPKLLGGMIRTLQNRLDELKDPTRGGAS